MLTEELSLEGIAGMVSIVSDADFVSHDNFNTLPVKSKSPLEEEDVIELMEKDAAAYNDSPFTKNVATNNRNVDMQTIQIDTL